MANPHLSLVYGHLFGATGKVRKVALPRYAHLPLIPSRFPILGLSIPLTVLSGLFFLGGNFQVPLHKLILLALILLLMMSVGPLNKADYGRLLVVNNKLLWRARYPLRLNK